LLLLARLSYSILLAKEAIFLFHLYACFWHGNKMR
jgi:hypothetical protein